MANDIIQDLKIRPFVKRNLIEKKNIIDVGRPTPTLTNKINKRGFQSRWYGRLDWMCGSITNEKLYCWPCLLFKPTKKHTWTDGGFNNFKNVLSEGKGHSKSQSHLHCYKSLKTFGKYNIESSMSGVAKLSNQQHNVNVKNNRQYLKQSTNALLYLSSQEIPLCGPYEKLNPFNKGNYRELLHCFAKLNSVFEYKLLTKKGPCFAEDSSQIQNKIVSSIDKVIEDEICREVKNVPFISIQIDETTGYTMHSQLSVIIRYVYESQIVERFLGLFEVIQDKTATELSNLIEKVLDKFDDAKSKLVSQTYDGGAVVPGDLNGIKINLREKGFKFGYFIHGFEHELNLIIIKSTEHIHGIRIFFANVRSFSKFAPKNTKMKIIFMNYNIIPSTIPDTKWCYGSSMVSYIRSEFFNLKKALQHILQNNKTWDEDSLCLTDSLSGKLNDFNFMFLVNCFGEIFAPADIVFNKIQNNILDLEFTQNNINELITLIKNLRNDQHYEIIYNQTMDLILHNYDELTSKLPEKKINYQSKYYEIIDNIIVSLEERFTGFEEFDFIELIDVEKFDGFSKIFPSKRVVCLLAKYAGVFDPNSLISELKYVYSDTDIKKCKTIHVILELIYEYDLLKVLPEVVKLIKLLLTLPVTFIPNQTSFSVLHRVRSYLRHTHANQKLSSLARISIEKEIIKNLENGQKLHNKILDEFALKPRLLEYIPTAQDLMDQIQGSLFSCCGINGMNDWDLNDYYNCNSTESIFWCGVPHSCCSKPFIEDDHDIDNYLCGSGVRLQKNKKMLGKIYIQGCLPSITNFINTFILPIAIVCIVVTVIMLSGAFFAQRLKKQVMRQKKR
ncbi:Zinc finger MYM-type protein 1 [Intoshia linei]|uniref:Zinc finger MYM-type protein 1 n=1 Tax=Intoshia linei TaxID=1819745 RepID=A0A177AY86_9BILA|nr:Zinc finger MYM-type protein 1 [Intoshia linei]